MQLDSENYIAVVNKAADDVAKTLGSSLSAPQIAFLKTVVRSLATYCFLPLASPPTCLGRDTSRTAIRCQGDCLCDKPPLDTLSGRSPNICWCQELSLCKPDLGILQIAVVQSACAVS